MKKILPWMLIVLAGIFSAQGGSVVTVGAGNVMSINGKKVFPIGFSPGPPTGGLTDDGTDGLQELRNAGALFYRLNQTNNWNTQAITNQQAALDWAGQHGMFCLIDLSELSAFPATDTNTPVMLTNVVNTFKNHAALGVWENKKEAWFNGVFVADLQRGYNLIKQYDTNHPIEQTHAPRGVLTNLQPYNAAADILDLDIYPISYPPGTNSLLTNKQISMVGDYTAFLSQVAGSQKEFWMTEQIAWSGVIPPANILHFPKFEQERYMAYQAIINGARGLLFYGGDIAQTLSPTDVPLGWNWTFWNQVLKPVVQQLGDNSLLADALAATNSTMAITMSGTTAPDIEFCVREAAPYLYIIACKREGPTLQATFSGLPTNITTGDLLYESPRTVTVSSGQFTDWFGPNEVHAYRFLNTNQITVPTTNNIKFYEPFAYTNIGGNVSANNPTNWALNGSGTDDLNVTSNNLSYPGLVASTGRSVTNGGNGLGCRRLFGVGAADGLVYFSALFQISDFGSWNGTSSQVGALTASDNQTFRLAVQIVQVSSTNYLFGVQKGGTGVSPTFDTNYHHLGETILLVGKYDFTTTPNVVTLWIDPASATFGTTNEPAIGYLRASTGTDGYIIDRFNFRQNTSTSVPAAMQWDELRIGTTWADVTPTH